MKLRFAMLLGLFGCLGAEARDFGGYMMETNEELRLAATAAPE